MYKFNILAVILMLALDYTCSQIPGTVEVQWLEHLWDHANVLETWVVRATEG